MFTKRHTPTCRHPLFLFAVFTLGIASIFAVVVTSLAQAHGAPAPGAVALRLAANEPRFVQESPSQGAGAADEPMLEYVPGMVLVKLKAAAASPMQSGMAAAQGMDAGAAGAVNLFRSYGVISAEPLFSTAASPAGYATQAALGGEGALARVYKLHLAAQLDTGQIAAALAADANVEYAEPDYMARAIRTPNDPDYGVQWALAKVGAPAAWDLQTGSPDVVIAVVDSGIDTAHPEFAGRLWENDDPVDGIDNDLNGQVDDTHGWNVLANNNDLADPSGHGTQVGGVIGAAADNAVGVAGMCWNCKLMFVKAMQASGAANYSDVAKAVQYAASNGAQVINLSLGGYADSAVLHDAIREAATTAVIVAGAGNDDSAGVFYPAAYPEVLAIAATDQNDQKAIFSNYGSWVDVAAPGTDIRTTTLGEYTTGSGTSLSAGVVSGLAGLVKSQHPAWTPEQIKWQILNTAANVDAANPSRVGQLGSGRVDAGGALAVTPSAKALVAGYSIDGQANGRPAPGQSLELVLTIQNQWLPAQDLQGTLGSSDSYVSITDGSGGFGSIAPGKSGSNAGDPFGITVGASAPYNRQLAFMLNLSGAGGYSLSLPFTIQVRSATETLGNTQFVQDTTWTSDKTYVLAGSVIVGQGVTLTIQPGTVIKGDAGRFIRVDGTLIARGTAEEPIIFASNSITNANWAGLRFADSAVNTTYGADGEYAGGSVLQHVEVSKADYGVNVGTRSLLIADSKFTNNSTSIQASGGAAHVMHNTFSGAGSSMSAPNPFAGTEISFDNGQYVIQDNTFTGGGKGIWGAGSTFISRNTFQNMLTYAIQVSGPSSVVGNTIRNNAGTGITAGGCCNGPSPVVRDNVVIGNDAGIMVAGSQNLAVEHNLVADNDNGVALEVQAPVQQLSPALAYNSAADEYILAWTETDNTAYVSSKVHLVRVAGDGQPLSLPAFTLPGFAPTIAYNPAANEYLLASVGGAYGGVYIQRLSAGAEPLGAATFLAGTQLTDRVRGVYQAADSSYLLVYRTTAPGFGLYAQRVALDGSLAGSASGVGGDIGGEILLGDVSYDATNNRSLVTFLSSSALDTLYGAWISSAGAVSASFVLDRDMQGRSLRVPSSVFGAEVGRYVSLWAPNSTWDKARPLYSTMLTADGSASITATTVFSTATAAPDEMRVAFAADTQKFLAVWTGMDPIPQSGNNRVAAQLMDADGKPVGTPIPVSATATDGPKLSAPSVAYNSRRHEFMLAWNAASSDLGSPIFIYGQRISSSGALVDNAWTVPNEATPSVNFRFATAAGVRNNTIINNGQNGISVGGQAARYLTINHNNLFGNGTYDLYINNGAAGANSFTVDATGNYWNVPESAIAGRIRDCNFDENGCNTQNSVVGRAAFYPPLSAPDQTAPAFVHSVTMVPNPVGLQRGTVTVDFSRPMSTGVTPSVLFHDARRGTTVPVSFPYGSWGAPKLMVDPLGRTWLARSMTLMMYDMRHWHTITAPAGGSDYVTAIYGASNGDVWVGLCCGDIAAARLRNSTWTTYTQAAVGSPGLSRVYTIIEDLNGAIWFGTNSGVFRFDGTTWAHVASDGALGGVEVWQSARDGQGRIWLLTSNHTGQSTIKVFDGVDWITYDSAAGLPVMYGGPMFADSKGRIWVNTTNGDAGVGPAVVSMFDGTWHFFGNDSTGGQLVNAVYGFGETSDGTIWMRSGSSNRATVTYKDGRWGKVGNVLGMGPLQIDSYDNIWYGDATGEINVLWGGADYAFENGHWISSTRFQADFAFTPDVPPGAYAVEMPGALDSGGMSAYTTGATTFTVDFGAGVTLDPPIPPAVAAQTTGSLSNLSASWADGGPNVDRYRYAIGTAPGARDIVGWTYLVSTSFVRNDLNLTQGQTYYVSVQAQNSSGVWSANGVSNGIAAGQVPTPTPTPSPTPTEAPFIQPGTGGAQTGQLGNLGLSLTVPPNAITEPIRLSMQPVSTPPSTGGMAILGQSFAINAQTAGGAPVTQFAAPLVLVIHYTDAEAVGLDENTLQLFYWSEVQQQWIGVPTTVDAQANTLTVYLDHLTLFAVLETEAPVPKLYLPQIRR